MKIFPSDPGASLSNLRDESGVWRAEGVSCMDVWRKSLPFRGMARAKALSGQCACHVEGPDKEEGVREVAFRTRP